MGYLYEKGWKQEYRNEKKEVKNMEEEKVMVEYSGIRYFNKEKPGMSILKTVLGKIFLTKDHFIFVGNIRGTGGMKKVAAIAVGGVLGDYLSEKSLSEVDLSDLTEDNSILIPIESIISAEKKRTMNYPGGYLSLKYKTKGGQEVRISFVKGKGLGGMGDIADRIDELKRG